jgi:crossover junction endodeoxyribonuclease RuvC
VKLTLVGNGRAEKRQVALMVRAMLALDGTPPLDAADALALAITHLRVGTMAQKLTAAARPLPPRLVEALKRRRKHR